MDNIYAIVVIYNGMRSNWIQKCFDSLQQSSVDITIIAIDNNSSDDSVDFIEANYPNVLLIQSSVNLGFGGANNQGLKKALELGGEYFFLLNQDAWVSTKTIESLVSIASQNPDYAVISPMHLNGKGSALDYNFSLQINPAHCPQLYSDIYLDKIENKIYQVRFVCAAAWLLTKNSLKRVGGFSPMFFHYGEDDNYCHRVLFKGMKIGVYPNAVIFHDREGRKAGVNEDKIFLKRKFTTMRFMNPNLDNSFPKEIRILYIQSVKAVVRMDMKKLGEILQEIKLLKKIKKLLPQYSIRSDEEFQYLKD